MTYWNIAIHIDSSDGQQIGTFLGETDSDIEPSDSDCYRAAASYGLPVKPPLVFMSRRTLLAGHTPVEPCFAASGTKLWLIKRSDRH